MPRLFRRYPGFRQRALTLSYDDGTIHDVRLVEILKKHGIKATFNLNSGLFGSGRRLPESEVLSLFRDSEMEIAVHGLEHPHWNRLPSAMAAYDILTDRVNLERAFGRIIRGSAYPFGAVSDTVVNVLTNAGLVYCRTPGSSERFDIPTDWMRLCPTCHHGNDRLPELCERFLAPIPHKHPLLFFLWGHSYEFEDGNNWHIIEDFAEKMGGRDEIWYATNIELYEYLEAFSRLVFSADGRYVYNPTTTELYFELGGRNCRLRPGETLYS